MPTRGDLIETYSRREPKHFRQLDCFVGEPHGGDSLVRFDAEGHAIWSIETWELMSGRPAVRVLVADGVARSEVAAILRKIAASVDVDDGILRDDEVADPATT